MASVPNAFPQLSTAGFAIDPLGIGSNVGCGAFKSASIADAQSQCLREYCAFLNKKLASVARDPAITPASGLSENGAYVHSSVLCRAGANGCEEALLGVANLKGTLLNQGAACVRTPHADTSRADMWQLDLTPGTPPKPMQRLRALTLVAGAMLELLGRQNSPACSFVIGNAGSGKTQLLLSLARQCTESASSESLCLVPVFLKPYLVNESAALDAAPSRFVESILRSAVQCVTSGEGLTSATSSIGSVSEYAASLTRALLALCPSRRLLLIYDANDVCHKGDLISLIQACRAGCHVIISGQDDSVLDAWTIEESNSGLRTARPSSSLALTLLQPQRQYLVIGGVECDPASVLGEKSCAGVRNWWLLKNIVRFNMLSTSHNRHIASGRIPPFGPALRLQTWSRLIFDAMNWECARLNAHSLLFADTFPQTAVASEQCARGIFLVLGRIAFVRKSRSESVSDMQFIKWLLAMPAYAGTTVHDARLVLNSLRRSGVSRNIFPLNQLCCVTPSSGLLLNESLSAQSGSDIRFRLCCSGVADVTLSLLSTTRISAMLGALWAWQSDSATWNTILSAAWLHQVDSREWLVYTLLRLKEPVRQRAIMSLFPSTDPTNADACIMIQAYESVLMEQTFSRDADSNQHGMTLDDRDGVYALLMPSFEPAQQHFFMRMCELARQPWWEAAVHRALLSASAWVQDVALDVVSRLRIDNAAVLKSGACALTSPNTSIAMKLGAACALGRIQISPSSVASLVMCVAESGVHQELRKQCMLSLLCVSSRLRPTYESVINLDTESHAAVSINLLAVAAVRFACDVDKGVSCIAGFICEHHKSLLLAFMYGTQIPHEFSQRWLNSGDCACASASAASTISSFQGDEAVLGALLHLLRRGDKVASISAASALSVIADPSIRVVRECTQAFLNQHGNCENHWSAARKVLAKTLCDLVTRAICPAAVLSMCNVVINGLEKVLGIKDRDAEMHQVAMTSSLTDLLRVVSLESQDTSRRYVIVDSESEIRQNDSSLTFILRSDIAEAKRLAILVIGYHVSAHGWVDGLLVLSDDYNASDDASRIYVEALKVITAIAMCDAHDLQQDALAAILPFLKLKCVPREATNVILWILQRLTQEVENLHNFMNSAPPEARVLQQRKADKSDEMDLALKDMFLPADMRLQSVLVSQWQSTGQGAWMQLMMRCKLVIGALHCDFLGTEGYCVSELVDMCTNCLQALCRCLDLYDLPVIRTHLVDIVFDYWTAVNNCKLYSKCSSLWAVAILSTSNSLSFGILAPPEVPRFASLIDERIVDAVKTHLFSACVSIRERKCKINVFETFADLKNELWRMTVHLAANDSSILHRAQWQRAAVAIACESGSLEWIAEARGLLLSGLMDPTKVVRQASAELLSAFVDQRVELLQLLRPYMLSKSPDCRLRGIEASLVLFLSPADAIDSNLTKDGNTYLALLSGMLDDDNIAVRCAVIDAISQVDSQGVHFRKLVQLLDDPAAQIRLASARVVVKKKIRDVGVASVILGAIVSDKARTMNHQMAGLQAIDAISQVGANSPDEWAALLGCIGIASSDANESMSLMASASLAKGTGLVIRSAHAAMDIIPLLNDSNACGPAVQLLGTFSERFCCLPTTFRTPIPRITNSASNLSSYSSNVLRSIPHLDGSIRALPAACCRSVFEAILRLKNIDWPTQPCEPIVLWWFLRVHGLIPCSDTDFGSAMQWISE